MKRRRFLALSGAVAAGLAGAAAWRRATTPAPSLAALIDELEAMRGRTLETSGAWSPFKVFTHLAQSIDYSMTGYPEMKSAVFQQTVGRAVFFAFSTIGAMRHDLGAPIPGAPALPEDGPTDDAIDGLLDSFGRFEGYAGALQPHFAYGDLSRNDYRAAHILHVRNHLEEFAII